MVAADAGARRPTFPREALAYLRELGESALLALPGGREVQGAGRELTHGAI